VSACVQWSVKKLACGARAFRDDGVCCLSHANRVSQGPNMIALRTPYRRNGIKKRIVEVEVSSRDRQS
jgi:hypothetical protein